MLIQTLAPTVEPVSVAEAKNFIRLDSDITQDDVLLNMLIAAARRHAESYTNRSFITQKWRLVLDGFYCDDCISLDRGTVQSIDSITYTAMDGTPQTVATLIYTADLSGCPARLMAGYGQVWPVSTPQVGAVQINYTAGYGPAATDVPEGIRNWLLLRVGSLYQNREEQAIMMPRGVIGALPFIDSLLDPYRVVTA